MKNEFEKLKARINFMKAQRNYLIWEEKPTVYRYYAGGFGDVTWFIMNKIDIPGFNHRYDKIVVRKLTVLHNC